MTPRTRRSIILISISLALATAAAVLANRWVNNRAAAVDATRPQQIGVVVAAADIPFGATIEARHLKKIEMVARERPPGSFTDPADVVGKVATAEILADEVLLERRFVTPGPGSPLAAVLAPEMRAVSVRVDDVVGVGGFILPGNRVDVIAARATGERAYAETILSNVKVLAVDQQASADKSAPVVVRAVTLEVTPDGAEELARAKQLGALQLSLRNPMDRSVHVADSGPGAIESPIVVATAAPTPAAVEAPRSAAPRIRRTPPGTDGISVIRGTEVTRSKDY
jgi:pilus assembly protein CpaB